MNEITPAKLKAWMKSQNITQVGLAELLGTNQSSVNRWLKNTVAIAEPEKKLLAYLMYGELPFGIAQGGEGWNLEFTESELQIIQLCARRDGFHSVEKWVTEKIRIYIAMTAGDALSADKEINYKTRK